MIYFNNAASSWPKAPGVIEAISESLSNPPFHPGRAVEPSMDPLTECRKRLSDLLGAEGPDRIVLTVNSTQALNLAILGIGLTSGSRVITTVTEHNSVLRPLNHLQTRSGIKIIYIGLDNHLKLDISAFDREIGLGADLVVINHVSNVTGQINDVRVLFAKAKECGAITLLDASQSIGHVNFNVKEVKADLVAFTGHKGVHGPPGTGGLYVAPHIKLDQVFVGGTGVRSDLVLHPQEMPTRLEAGTPNIPAFAGLAKSLEWYEKEGHTFNQRANLLMATLKNGLREIPKVSIFGNLSDSEHVPILSFKVDGWDVEETGYVLAHSFGIINRTGLHCAPLIHKSIGSYPDGTVRFSLSGFNTESEVVEAISAIKKLVR